MKNTHPLMRVIALPLIALFVAACGGNDMPELEPDQALLRVENNITGSRYITVAVEDMAGTTVTLGNVQEGDAVNFPLLAPDYTDDMRLIAVQPGDDERGDHVISEPFSVQAGWTINWFVPTNNLEVSQ